MCNNKVGRPIEILLVEDNPADVRLTVEALKEGKVKNNLHVVEDGEEVLKFLNNEDIYSNCPLPDIILLDLNLPKINGIEVLAQIKRDECFKRIPVVILTTSKDEEDIINTYKNHGNCYITKPVDLEKFINIVKSIENFWLSIVKLPS